MEYVVGAYVGFVQPWSGLALREDLSIANTREEHPHIEKGKRIARLVIQKVPVEGRRRHDVRRALRYPSFDIGKVTKA